MYISFKVDCSDEWQVGSADLGSSIVYVHKVYGQAVYTVCVHFWMFLTKGYSSLFNTLYLIHCVALFLKGFSFIFMQGRA